MLLRTPVVIDWSDSPLCAAFKAAMDDDFNTPGAVAVLFDLAANVNRGQGEDAPLLKALGGVLGLLQQAPNDYLQAGSAGLDTAAIQALIEARADGQAGP